jgi:hypothetical protein
MNIAAASTSGVTRVFILDILSVDRRSLMPKAVSPDKKQRIL